MPEACQNNPESMAVTDTAGVRLRVVRAAEDLESIRAAWESMQRHPNADYEFYRLINGSRENVLRPHVILLEEAERPRAMMIGRIEQSTLECGIGYLKLWRPRVRMLTIIYGGIVGDLAPAAAERLAGALLDTLACGEADVARIGGLDPEGELCRLLRRAPGALCRDHLAAPTPHWEITLPGSYEEYLARFKPKVRSEMRRSERKFEHETEGAACRLFTREDEVAQLCADARNSGAPDVSARHRCRLCRRPRTPPPPGAGRRARLAAGLGDLRRRRAVRLRDRDPLPGDLLSGLHGL